CYSAAMKGLGISVPPLHAGVRFDLEALLAAFKEKNSVRFEAFSEVFAALKMSMIFAGRQTAAELIEFEEHLLQLSAAYMMSIKSGEIAGYPERFDPNAKPDIPSYTRSDRPLENLPAGVMGTRKEREEEGGESEAYVMTLVERMFGIYCCYSFYYLQPKDYMAQIRISPAQLRDVTDFMEDRLRTERHLDAMACLYKLLNEGAFRITAFELMYDPACHKRYEAEDEDETCLPPGADAPLERMKGLTEDRTMQQLEMLHKTYEKAKKDAGFKGVTHGEIDVMDSAKKILANAKVSIQMDEMYAMGQLGGADGGVAPSSGRASSPSRLDIKQRAYSSGVTASRHRRYAFADGDETVARMSGADSDEDAPGTSKKEKRKKGRPSRKSQRDEKADEFMQELAELGVPGVVKRRNTSPRKSISQADKQSDGGFLDEISGKAKKKRINKREAKKNESALVRVTKSKAEEAADRELAKLEKMLKNQGGA
ncbi:hypothetical protein PMAYCL1PPCAC_08976, partial [Pristionchus mayeri]